MTNNSQFKFTCATQVIQPKGKLVYEYNPLYNYRVDKQVYLKDAEGNYLDKNRNVIIEATEKISDDIKKGDYYYTTKTNGVTIYHKSQRVLEDDGILLDLITGGTYSDGTKMDDVLNFDLTHPVDILCQLSYDGSTNLILNDGKNIPRLINSRFTPLENNTYERIDRKGNTDTNIYDYDEFEIDSSLFKRYNSIPLILFLKVVHGGNLKIGNYVFYFKLADGDGNETDFVGESGIVSIHMGALNTPHSIRGGSANENGNKTIVFTLTKIDSAYDYVVVYYTRTTGDDTAGTQVTTAHKLDRKYRTNLNMCTIHITGDEVVLDIDVSEINLSFFIASSAKTLTICLNRLFLGNVTKSTIEYEELQRLSLLFYPFYVESKEDALIGCLLFDYKDAFGGYEYYNTKNIYDFVGYWPEEMYRFGIVYIMNDNSLSPVFNIRGIKNLPKFTTADFNYTTKNTKGAVLRSPYEIYTKPEDLIIDYDNLIINENTLENSAGVVQFPEAKVNSSVITKYDDKKENNTGNLSVYGLKVVPGENVLEDLKKYNVKGYFFVRLKRIPTILGQAFVTGVDEISGLPLVYLGNDGTDDLFAIETFVNNKGELDGDLYDRMIVVNKASSTARAAFCPEFELDQPYYNNFFTNSSFIVRPITGELSLCADDRHFYSNWNNSMTVAKDTSYQSCNIISVGDCVLATTANDFTFRSKAGNAEDITYEYIYLEETDKNKPTKDNFSHNIRKRYKWLKVIKVAAVAVAVAALAVASIYTGGAAAVAFGTVGSSLFSGGIAITATAETALGISLGIGSAIAVGAGAMATSATALAAATAMKNLYSKATGNYSENRVKITRGAFGPYLGLTNASELHYNTLYNIYVPGYLSQSSYDYFNIRMRDDSPYYAISDRFLLDRDSMDLSVFYRGDCYISTFTHRINRNFQDPDAPTNDKIVDKNSWIDNWDSKKGKTSEVNRGDVNAVKLGTWITFKCYTSRNLALRDWDSTNPVEESLTGHKRAFYPLQSMSISGNYKVPNSNKYNCGFTTSTSAKLNYILPNVPYIKNTYQTRIMYSNPAPTDSFKNGLREFQLVSYRDYPNQYGGLMRLVTLGSNIIAVFEHAVALIPVNERTLLNATDEQVAVGVAKVIPDSLSVLSDSFGTQWAESVCVTPNFVYGIDTVAKKIWRTNGRLLELISDFKVQKFLNDNITLTERELTPIIGIRNVKTHYNAFKRDVMFTYYDDRTGFEEVVWNLCYNEILGVFTTFYSWVPSYSANIDNIFFSYDRNSSKWIAKLGASNAENKNCADGICFNNLTNSEFSGVNIDAWLYKVSVIDSTSGKEVKDVYVQTLNIKNRLLPESSFNYIKLFTLERDNFRNDTYFGVALDDEGNYLIYITRDKLDALRSKLLSSDPQIPVILLNLACNIQVQTDSQASNSGDWHNWERFFSYNYGTYQSLVALTFEKVLNRQEYIEKGFNYPKLRTDFWKHGQAGIIDIQEKILPCHWYGKQHPFEFEFVVGNDSALYKRFDSLVLVSNNVCPESIHYTIVGDTYDFVNDKSNMYFRQEATKAFYLYNGSDILYNHDTFDTKNGITPKIITASDSIDKDACGNYLRDSQAQSSLYKATVFPLLYARDDTFNEVEDYYRTITAPYGKDYPNLTGCELVWDETLNEFRLSNHVKARDMRRVGISRGNCRYVNDRWECQITPITLYLRNEHWINNVPPLLLYNIPQKVFTGALGLSIPETLKQVGYKYPTLLDKTSWNNIANTRKEAKLMDKYIKVRIRYSGDLLTMILATTTKYNTIG